MTKPFTCRAIARPFARLAIARFYVYGLIMLMVLYKTVHRYCNVCLFVCFLFLFFVLINFDFLTKSSVILIYKI